MSVQIKLQEQYKEALKAKAAERLEVLRGLMAEIKNKEIDSSKELEDSDIIKVVKSEIKKRKDAIDMYAQAGRQELADAELAEITILEEFLPKQISDEKLGEIVDSIISTMENLTIKDMGKVIGLVAAQVGDTADGGRIAQSVKEKLNT